MENLPQQGDKARQAAARADYIVGSLIEAGSMYPDDAAEFLAEHDAHRRAEVLAEVKTEVVAWLVKKAAERQMWDAGTLASKVDRGAVRAFLGTGHYRDAMDEHRAETRRDTYLEAADQIEVWQNDADDAAALDHGALTDAETAAHVAVRRAAKALREVAAGMPAGAPGRPAPTPDPMPAIRAAILDFDFEGYGLHDVDPTSEYAEWVGDLAAAIAGALPDHNPQA